MLRTALDDEYCIMAEIDDGESPKNVSRAILYCLSVRPGSCSRNFAIRLRLLAFTKSSISAKNSSDESEAMVEDMLLTNLRCPSSPESIELRASQMALSRVMAADFLLAG